VNPLKHLILLIRSLISLVIGLPRLLAVRWIRVTTIVVVLLLAGLGLYRFLFPPLPKSVEVYDIVWLEQGWTEAERQAVYHVSQGTLIIPYNWFFALGEPPALSWPIEIGGKDLFFTNATITRYRAIPDPRAGVNPDRLPIGITKHVIEDKYVDQLGQGHKEWLSYTCAFCHTTQINYKGIGVRIDGGPGNLDFNQFNSMLANLLVLTDVNPARFERFAERVLHREKKAFTSSNKEALHSQLRSFLRSPAIRSGVLAILQGTFPTKEGFGRMDALGRGVNGQFGQLDMRNVGVGNAPVSIPPLWHSHEYGWVQTGATIRQPMGRNLMEAWGVNASVDLTNPDPSKLYATTVSMKNEFWIETLNSTLRAPQWPEPIFGGVDRVAAKRGQYLYEEAVFANALAPEQELCGPPDCESLVPRPAKGLCARCHAPVRETQRPEEGGPFYQLPMYKLDVIGTDPGDVKNFAARTIYTGRLKDVLFGGKEVVGVGAAFALTSDKIMDRQYNELGVPAAARAEWDGFRKNVFRAVDAYPARPNQGFWATAPFLHNNSVASLYELLSPVSERRSSFWSGDLEFDPVHVGYQSDKFRGGFEFQVRLGYLEALWRSVRNVFRGQFEYAREIAGNSNAGHEFRDAPKGTPGVIGPGLNPQQRQDIVEYMKIIKDFPPIDPAEMARRRAMLEGMKKDFIPAVP